MHKSPQQVRQEQGQYINSAPLVRRRIGIAPSDYSYVQRVHPRTDGRGGPPDTYIPNRVIYARIPRNLELPPPSQEVTQEMAENNHLLGKVTSAIDALGKF